MLLASLARHEGRQHICNQVVEQNFLCYTGYIYRPKGPWMSHAHFFFPVPWPQLLSFHGPILSYQGRSRLDIIISPSNAETSREIVAPFFLHAASSCCMTSIPTLFQPPSIDDPPAGRRKTIPPFFQFLIEQDPRGGGSRDAADLDPRRLRSWRRRQSA